MMFKRLVNTLMAAIVPMVISASYWDFIKFTDSLILFGEPTCSSDIF